MGAEGRAEALGRGGTGSELERCRWGNQQARLGGMGNRSVMPWVSGLPKAGWWLPKVTTRRRLHWGEPGAGPLVGCMEWRRMGVIKGQHREQGARGRLSDAWRVGPAWGYGGCGRLREGWKEASWMCALTHTT